MESNSSYNLFQVTVLKRLDSLPHVLKFDLNVLTLPHLCQLPAFLQNKFVYLLPVFIPDAHPLQLALYFCQFWIIPIKNGIKSEKFLEKTQILLR